MHARILAEKRRAEAELQAERGRAAAELQAERRRGEDHVEKEKRRSEQALEAERRRAEGELEAERRRSEMELRSEKRRSDEALEAERRRAEEELEAERRRLEQEFDSAMRKADAGAMVVSRRTAEAALAGDKAAEAEVEAQKGHAEGDFLYLEARRGDAEMGLEGRKLHMPARADGEPHGRALAPQVALSTERKVPPCTDTPVLDEAAQPFEGNVAQNAPAAVPASAENKTPQEEREEGTFSNTPDSAPDKQASPRAAPRTKTCQSQTERPGHGRASTQTLRTCTVSAQAQTPRPTSMSKWTQTPPLDTSPADSRRSACPVPGAAVDHATQVDFEPLQARLRPEPRVRDAGLAGEETRVILVAHSPREVSDEVPQTGACESVHLPVRHVTPSGSSTRVHACRTLPGVESASATSADPPGHRLAERQDLPGKVSSGTDAESPRGYRRNDTSQTRDRTAVDGSDVYSEASDLQEPEALDPVRSRATRAHSWGREGAELLEWACAGPELDPRGSRSSLEEVAEFRALAEERRLQLESAYAELEVCMSCSHVRSPACND